MGNNQDWFWTLEKLEKLYQILCDLAQLDEEGFYFGRVGLASSVLHNSQNTEFETITRISHGLTILVFLGVIAPGYPGSKPPGYKRRFYPEIPITQEGIDAYRQTQREQ